MWTIQEYCNATDSYGVRVVQILAPPPASFGTATPDTLTTGQTSVVVDSGLNGPSGFEIAPDGRIFILERAGTIKIVKNGQLLPAPFAVLPSEDTGDRGLIGIAFDPDFGVSNHYVYFYYTGHDLLNHLVRFSAAEDVGTDGPFELFRTSSASAPTTRREPCRSSRTATRSTTTSPHREWTSSRCSPAS